MAQRSPRRDAPEFGAVCCKLAASANRCESAESTRDANRSDRSNCPTAPVSNRIPQLPASLGMLRRAEAYISVSLRRERVSGGDAPLQAVALLVIGWRSRCAERVHPVVHGWGNGPGGSVPPDAHL